MRNPHQQPLPPQSETLTHGLEQQPVAVHQERDSWRSEFSNDDVAVEVPIALVYNGISHVVMMATPADLAELALGFSLSEGILAHPRECYDWEVVQAPTGLTVHLTISSQRMATLKAQRRNQTGRTGCGLCGTEALAQAIRPIPCVIAPQISDAAIQWALTLLPRHQPLQAATGATHCAAWCDAQGEIIMVREDVGRHNALDKLIGALVQNKMGAVEGFVLVSSRASYEMVHKCASAGIGALVAASAATTLAIQQARDAGLLLVGFARPGRHVVYHGTTHAKKERFTNLHPN